MPYCHAPWTNIDIDPEGKISPCCKFDYNKYEEPHLNITTSTIDQYLDSRVVKETKKQFEAGKWPAGCIRCKIEEDNNIESKRQVDYNRNPTRYDTYTENQKILTASVAFGNTCNLKCITCNPGSSSLWYKEAKVLLGKTRKPNHFYKNNFVADFLNNTPNLAHLDVPGGEPFLSGVDQQKELLKWYVDNDKAKNITIHYTTNCQIYPDDDYWNLWQNFKEVDIQLSIDGIDQRYEYIRFPADWKKFLNNCEKYINVENTNKNIRLSVSHTVSAYNVLYLDEFFTWCEDIGLPRPWCGAVYTPKHMRPSVFPIDIKQKIVNHLLQSDHHDVKTWANLVQKEDDSTKYEQFCTMTQKHDQYRGFDFNKTFPELAKLLAN